MWRSRGLSWWDPRSPDFLSAFEINPHTDREYRDDGGGKQRTDGRTNGWSAIRTANERTKERTSERENQEGNACGRICGHMCLVILAARNVSGPPPGSTTGMQYTMTSPARERGTESEYKEATATSALILGFAPKVSYYSVHNLFGFSCSAVLSGTTRLAV